MDSINFGNLTYNESNKKIQNQNNQQTIQQPEFGALDKAKLEADAVQIAGKTKEKTKEQVKENFIFRTLRNTFGVEDPKKLFTSLGLTVATVVGLAVFGNKMSNPTANLGNKVDKFLENNKAYKTIGNFFSKAKSSIGGFFKKSKTIKDVSETLKNRKAKPKSDFTRGYGRGFVSIFALTPVDILEKAFKQAGIDDVQSATKAMKKLVGDTPEAEKLAMQILGVENVQKATKTLRKVVPDPNLASSLAKETERIKNAKKLTKVLQEKLGNVPNIEDLANEIISQRTVKDNRAFCESLSNAMRKNLGCAGNTADDFAKFNKYLQEMQKGKLNGVDVSEFTGIDMKGGGPLGSWWPVNIVNSIGKKLGMKKGFCRGNLGDSLVKFNAVNGTLAKTKVGSFVQKMTTVPTESITNFVNDKSGLGVMLCASILSLYNNVQDAPKEKKVATIADDYVGTIGSIAIATPLAFGATYGLASLKNVKGNTIFSKGLKQIGKFFGMGLEKYAKDGKPIGATSNKLIGFLGGALRLVLIMFVFSPKFSKPIQDIIHKIFGKPYNKAEEEQKKALEAQKQTVIPELGITQGELMEKIQKNPQALERLQKDPMLLREVESNPKKLLEVLDGTTSKTPAQTPSNKPLSPANQNLINKRNNSLNNQNNLSNPAQAAGLKAPEANKQNSAQQKNDSQEQDGEKPIDTATYIPSSEYIAKTSVSDEQSQEINDALARADKVLAKAEQFI